MTTLARFGLLVGILAVVACAEPPKASPPPPPDTRAADEAAIQAAVKEWSASALAKDADKFVSFYAEDAVIMLEDSPDVSGKAAIREAIGGMMQDPNFSLTFEPDKVVTSRSGDLAYETGPYALTLSDPKKKATTEKGHYLVVWQKEAGGAWKVVRDVPVSDPPEEAAKK